MKTKLIGMIGVATMLAGVSFGQNTVQGLQVFVTGPTPEFDGWNPGGTPAMQLKDDGTGGDATGGDGVFSLDYAPPGVTAPVGGLSEWKVGSGTPNQWSISIPPGGNSRASLTTGVLTKFILDTRTRADGFQPNPNGSTVLGVAYTQPAAAEGATTTAIAGSFISEVGGTDWTPSDPTGQMFDDGTNGGDTTAADKIFSASFTGIPAGGYEFKVTFNGSFDHAVGTEGYSSGGNIPMTVLSNTDQIRILFDVRTGQYKIENNNPLASAGPPFFGVSSAWGTVLDASTQLYDDGSNGDVTNGDGVYTRLFTASTSGTVQVKQYQGDSYPDSGGVPFEIQAAGQQVLVQFDTRVYNDGFQPNTRFVWTDVATRHAFTAGSPVQAVGDFMDELGGAGDWNNNDGNFRLFDDGANSDGGAGDSIWGFNFGSTGGLTYKQVKAVQQGSWTYQLGGYGEGITQSGDNTALRFTIASGQDLIIKVDSITGRVGVGASNPARPATLNAPPTITAAAQDWQMFQ